MVMQAYNTVDEACEALNAPNGPAWPHDRDYRLWQLKDSYITSTLNKGADPNDGFGWCGLHRVETSGATSASGYHRSKKRAFMMKECKPFAVKLLVWDAKKAMDKARRWWGYYSDEERNDLETVLKQALLKSVDLKLIRRESPFAKWSDAANTVVERTQAQEALAADADRLLAESGAAYVLAA